jgi:hypothetical protein
MPLYVLCSLLTKVRAVELPHRFCHSSLLQYGAIKIRTGLCFYHTKRHSSTAISAQTCTNPFGAVLYHSRTSCAYPATLSPLRPLHTVRPRLGSPCLASLQLKPRSGTETFAVPQLRVLPSDGCACHATEFFAMTTSPLSFDFLVIGSVNELNCVPLDLLLLRVWERGMMIPAKHAFSSPHLHLSTNPYCGVV